MHNRRFFAFIVGSVALAAGGLYACVEAPPKISAVPASGLSLRVQVFGASAEEAYRAFDAVTRNNPTFSLVREGGDGEVVVGLENDSPKCVPPTGLCSYKVVYRIRDKKGDAVYSQATNIASTSEHCSDLCSKALNNVAVKVVETASAVLKGAGVPADASDDAATDASPDATATTHGRGSKKPSKGDAAAPPGPAKPTPGMCSVGAGPRLASEEAEKRASQVEVLKRLNVLDQDEYDCLRKAYLDRR